MPKGYQHLTRDKRCQIACLLKRGDSLRSIANCLQVSTSTISREIQRNKNKIYMYNSNYAQILASQRMQKSRARAKKLSNKKLRRYVRFKLKLQWSPIQISGWLAKTRKIGLSHQTIYNYVWEDKKNGGILYKNLRHQGKKYRFRHSYSSNWGRIPGRVDIDQRPAVVEKKARLGDWELDLIVGHENSGYVVTMVDRATKTTKLAKIHKRTSYNVKEAICKKLSTIEHCVETLTSDNGKEFADHKAISNALSAQFYFATPYRAWERGLNEHTNGLIRQYLPKKQTFDTLTQERLDEIEELLNNRPRKILHFDTPNKVFNRLEKRTTKCCTLPLKGPYKT